MNSSLAIPVTALGPHAALTLRNRRGHAIECVSGELWITQDGDSRDIVLARGERFTLDRDGAVLVTALGPARVRVHVPTRTAPAPWWKPWRPAVLSMHGGRDAIAAVP